MPLDANLFVLSLVPRPNSVGWVDIKEDNSLDAQYVAHKDGDVISLIDPWTDTRWASISTVSAKAKLVEFCNPDHSEEFKNTGKLGWEWSWEWEGVKYAWDRSGSITGEKSYTLEVIRKPDPNFPICIHTPAGKKKAAKCQILDYNLARIEPLVEDRKGLEIMTLLTLISLLSSPQFDIFGLSSTSETPPVSANPSSNSSNLAVSAVSASAAVPDDSTSGKGKGKGKDGALAACAPPPMPPMPPKASSSQRLSTNEIEVRDESKQDEYCARALELFKDDGLLFVVLLGSGAIVPQVVALAEMIKRRRYKASGEELMQFIDDEAPKSTSSKKYATPTSIKIYLSRIEMRDILPNYKPKQAPSRKPELRPPIVFGSSEASSPRPPPANSNKKPPDGNAGGGGILAKLGF